MAEETTAAKMAGKKDGNDDEQEHKYPGGFTEIHFESFL